MEPESGVLQYTRKDLMGEFAPQTFRVVRTDEGLMTEAFGRLWPVQNDISLHLTAWRIGLKKSDGGLGPLRHLIEAHNLIWPDLIPSNNEWLFRRYSAFCKQDKYPIVTLAGGSGTAKSSDTARFALLWWWANPEERAVLIASTTISALKKRIWSYVAERFYKARGQMPGSVTTNPHPSILFSKKDPKHGIHGIALREGPAERTLADVIGIHPIESLLAIIDEEPDVTPAINDVAINWDDGNGKLHQVIGLGNSKSRLDPHGKMSEPKVGWNNINPDIDEEWETKCGGICLFFDCYKSPALHAPNKEHLQFLIGEKKIKREEARYGKNDPKFWRFVRGFWPPEDLSKSVLTLSLVERHGARLPAHWGGSWQIPLAGLDPAFTSDGDECILRFATLGVLANGLVGLDFGGADNIISMQLDMRSKEPINYQIVRMAKKECLARGVRPEHFGIDTWGFGTGAGDILEMNWSPDVQRIIGIGAPSENFVDSDMTAKAYDLYDRRTTELWMDMRMFVQSDQIFGLDDQTVEEFCSRTYEWKGKKQCLEGKKDYKKRMGTEDGPTGSPDRADAAAIILAIARTAGLVFAGRENNDTENKEWEERWEASRGYRKSKEELREQQELAWNSDGILDSDSFMDTE